jgi:Transposase zinc-binding domain
MSRPPLEVADLIRSAGAAFIERNRQWLSWKHIKVLLAIARCRTAALGGHLDECTRCGHRATISSNSCRNRHCPKCQTAARERWIAARQRELLPTRYVHVVFTLPPQLAPLALQNKKVIYDLLFRASAETLLEVARDPKHLGAEIGFFTVLHTWNQKLGLHPRGHWETPRSSFFALDESSISCTLHAARNRMADVLCPDGQPEAMARIRSVGITSGLPVTSPECCTHECAGGVMGTEPPPLLRQADFAKTKTTGWGPALTGLPSTATRARRFRPPLVEIAPHLTILER